MMRQSPDELLAALRRADALGAFVFPMHEADGYQPANDMVIEAARGSDGLLVPFCRVDPNDNAPQEARRALAAGARGIKLHTRAEQFTLDHPQVRELFAIADEQTLPVLIHAGRGVPALGEHAVELASDFPGARLILAHAGITDLSWLWRVAADLPNLMFDTAWWMPADLLALFSLVPPGQILFASDMPYGHTLVSAAVQIRVMLQAGLSPIRFGASAPANRCGSPPAISSSRPGRRSVSASAPGMCCSTASLSSSRSGRSCRFGATSSVPRCSTSASSLARSRTRSTTRPCSRRSCPLLRPVRRGNAEDPENRGRMTS